VAFKEYHHMSAGNKKGESRKASTSSIENVCKVCSEADCKEVKAGNIY